MPLPDSSPITVEETEDALHLVLPTVPYGPDSDLNRAVEAFRHQVARVLAGRTLRALRDTLEAEPDHRPFELDWRHWEDGDQRGVRALMLRGMRELDHDELSDGQQHLLEIMNEAPNDPEIIAHLSDWFNGRRFANPDDVERAASVLVGPAWAKAQTAEQASALDRAVPRAAASKRGKPRI